MKISVIKHLAEQYLAADLQKAADHFENTGDLLFDVEGQDEGEQLTHLLAAAWISEQMSTQNIPYNQALRLYTQRVRTSIS